MNVSTPTYEWDSSMYRLAVAQLDAAALRMGLDENVWERLRHPQRAYVVSFPFRRDDYQTVDTLVGPAEVPWKQGLREMVEAVAPELLR